MGMAAVGGSLSSSVGPSSSVCVSDTLVFQFSGGVYLQKDKY